MPAAIAAEGSLKTQAPIKCTKLAHGQRDFLREERKFPPPPPGSSFLLKPALYWLFSVAGASFGLETFEPGGPNVSLDLAREPLNPRLFVPAP